MLKMILASAARIATGPLCCIWMWVISPAILGHDLPLDQLRLPPGFRISVFAEVRDPRQLAMNPTGILFAGSRRAGTVYAIIDSNGDWSADEVIEVDHGLTLPTGLAYRDGDLYVGALNEILVYRNIEARLRDKPRPEVLTNSLPDKRHHGLRVLEFGPDGYLYFNVGAPCNICLNDHPWFATIMRADVSHTPFIPEIYARGVRNSVGFTWHPKTGDLWFTDNGRDLLGDEAPPDELNQATRSGQHFGYPYIHGNDILDPAFGTELPENLVVTPPAQLLGAHVAPLGLAFYTSNLFPKQYQGSILIAEHGSWNRSPEAGHVGYRISRVTESRADGKPDYQPFIDGWLDSDDRWGRPVDLLVATDGSLLISDDKANVVYRVSYPAAAGD